MHLTPHELDKLTLHQAGVLAQKRLARGVRLNHPEAVALIATQILEFIRDGRSVAELMDLGRQLLGRADVMDGVPELVARSADRRHVSGRHQARDGAQPDRRRARQSRARAVRELPAGADDVRLKPDATTADAIAPGEITCAPGEIAANEGRETAQLAVTNRGDRPIQVGSHYHFVETNRALDFDRRAAYGMRLDIPAGTAVRFEPGETKTVALVAIAGRGVIRGGNDFARRVREPEP